jgi:hypothetical protein
VPPPTVLVVLELKPGADTIVGTLQQLPSDAREPFTGWLQLTEMLEVIRCTAGDGQPEAAQH